MAAQSHFLSSVNRTALTIICGGLAVAAVFHFWWKNQKYPKYHDPSKNDDIEKLVGPYKLSRDTLYRVMDLLEEEMNRGLGKDSHPSATVKMFPTYVRSLPNGTEKGDILALDLGGTNFRVLLIRLNGPKIDMRNKIFLIPHSLMCGTGERLFDHIAECLANFMHHEGLSGNGKKFPLGFTFSFPCAQHGLASATLVAWTKGFSCEGVVGQDVVQLLQKAIDKRGDIRVEIVALVNDTVGTMMSCALKDHDTRIGLILGTGTNACYMEQMDRVGTWNGDKEDPKQVIINMEWGAFGDNGCIDFLRTPHDKEVDESSINKGKQLYEKMISGMYMGEIVRLILLDLIDKEILFASLADKHEYIQPMFTKGNFYTKFVSEIETDSGVTFRHTKQVLAEMGIQRASMDDCATVQYVCKSVSKRAAQLASAGLSVLLNRIDRPRVVIGVDGSLYRFHPRFKSVMEKTIADIVKPSIKFKMMLSTDGSGKGAALVAAVATRIAEQKARRAHIS